MTRIAVSVNALTWIPMDALTGAMKMPFETGVAHYDPPPPERIEGPADREALRLADRFRFCNELSAFVEVEGDKIVDYGYLGGGHIGSTTLKLVGKGVTFAAVAYPDLQPDPVVADDASSLTFVQTAGGRTGAPMPRAVKHPPFVQIAAPTAWSTLELTIHADGTTEHRMTGASRFPRHWVYGPDGALSHKSSTIDFKEWSKKAFGKHSPWGDQDSPAIVTAVESATERELSKVIVDAKPKFSTLKDGETLVEQGDEGDEVFLLFDGVLSVEIDGELITELGPGAILGEMAVVSGGGKRNATVRAVTRCRLAAVPSDALDRDALEAIARTRET